MLKKEMMLFSQDLMMTFLVAGEGNDELYGRPEMICLRVERVQITLIVEMVLM